MKYILISILSFCVMACDSNTLHNSELERVKDICSKNGGVKGYQLYWADSKDSYNIIRVYCQDGANFEVFQTK